MKKIFIKLASLFLILFFVTSCNNGLQNKNTSKKNLVKFSLSVNYDKQETEADNQENDIFTKALLSRLVTPDMEQINEARKSLKYDFRGYNNKLYTKDSLCDFVMDCPIDELQSHIFEAEAGQWTLILIAHNDLNEELYRGEVSVLLKTENDPIMFYMQPVTEDANSELNLTFKFDYDECISHIEATIQDTGLAIPTDVAEISIDFVNDEATIFDYCEEIKDYFYDDEKGYFKPGNNSLEFYTVTYKKVNPESGVLEPIDDEEIAQFIDNYTMEAVCELEEGSNKQGRTPFVVFNFTLKLPEGSYSIGGEYVVNNRNWEGIDDDTGEDIWTPRDPETRRINRANVNTNYLVPAYITLGESASHNKQEVKFNTGKVTLSNFAWTEDNYNKVKALDLNSTDLTVNEYEIEYKNGNGDGTISTFVSNLGTKWFFEKNDSNELEFKVTYDEITWNFGKVDFTALAYEETCNLQPIKVEFNPHPDPNCSIETYNYNANTNIVDYKTTNELGFVPFFANKYFDGWYFDKEFTDELGISWSDGCGAESTSNKYYALYKSLEDASFSEKRTVYAKYKDNYTVQIKCPSNFYIENYYYTMELDEGHNYFEASGFFYKDKEGKDYYIYNKYKSGDFSLDYEGDAGRAALKVCPVSYDENTNILEIQNVSGSLNLSYFDMPKKEHYDVTIKDEKGNIYKPGSDDWDAKSFFNDDWSFSGGTANLEVVYEPREYEVSYKVYENYSGTEIKNQKYKYGDSVSTIALTEDLMENKPDGYSLYGWAIYEKHQLERKYYYFEKQNELEELIDSDDFYDNHWKILLPGEEIPDYYLNSDDDFTLWAIWLNNGRAEVDFYYYDYNDKSTGKKGMLYHTDKDTNQNLIYYGTKLYLNYSWFDDEVGPEQIVIFDEENNQVSKIEYNIYRNGEMTPENTRTCELTPENENTYLYIGDPTSEADKDFYLCEGQIILEPAKTYKLYKNVDGELKDLRSNIKSQTFVTKIVSGFGIPEPSITEDDLVVTMTKGLIRDEDDEYCGFYYNEFVAYSVSGKNYSSVAWFVNGSNLRDYADNYSEKLVFTENSEEHKLRIYFPREYTEEQLPGSLKNEKITVIGFLDDLDDFDSTSIYFTAKK